MAVDSDRNHEKVVEAAKGIEELRESNATLPVVLTGKIVNGKVILDQQVLDEIAKKYPNASGSFIAVNAPFDPGRLEN